MMLSATPMDVCTVRFQRASVLSRSVLYTMKQAWWHTKAKEMMPMAGKKLICGAGGGRGASGGARSRGAGAGAASAARRTHVDELQIALRADWQDHVGGL